MQNYLKFMISYPPPTHPEMTDFSLRNSKRSQVNAASNEKLSNTSTKVSLPNPSGTRGSAFLTE